MARAREALRGGRLPLGLGAGPGTAEHRRPRPAARNRGRDGWRVRGATSRSCASRRSRSSGAPGWAWADRRWPAPSAHARTLIDAEPYRESAYMLLMEALAAQGNVAEGLRVFESLRTLLREELGTMPSPEALAVHDAPAEPTAAQRAVPVSIDHERAGRRARAPARARCARRPELVGRAGRAGHAGAAVGARPPATDSPTETSS